MGRSRFNRPTFSSDGGVLADARASGPQQQQQQQQYYQQRQQPSGTAVRRATFSPPAAVGLQARATRMVTAPGAVEGLRAPARPTSAAGPGAGLGGVPVQPGSATAPTGPAGIPSRPPSAAAPATTQAVIPPAPQAEQAPQAPPGMSRPVSGASQPEEHHGGMSRPDSAGPGQGSAIRLPPPGRPSRLGRLRSLARLQPQPQFVLPPIASPARDVLLQQSPAQQQGQSPTGEVPAAEAEGEAAAAGTQEQGGQSPSGSVGRGALSPDQEPSAPSVVRSGSRSGSGSGAGSGQVTSAEQSRQGTTEGSTVPGSASAEQAVTTVAAPAGLPPRSRNGSGLFGGSRSNKVLPMPGGAGGSGADAGQGSGGPSGSASASASVHGSEGASPTITQPPSAESSFGVLPGSAGGSRSGKVTPEGDRAPVPLPRLPPLPPKPPQADGTRVTGQWAVDRFGRSRLAGDAAAGSMAGASAPGYGSEETGGSGRAASASGRLVHISAGSEPTGFSAAGVGGEVEPLGGQQQPLPLQQRFSSPEPHHHMHHLGAFGSSPSLIQQQQAWGALRHQLQPRSSGPGTGVWDLPQLPTWAQPMPQGTAGAGLGLGRRTASTSGAADGSPGPTGAGAGAGGAAGAAPPPGHKQPVPWYSDGGALLLSTRLSKAAAALARAAEGLPEPDALQSHWAATGKGRSYKKRPPSSSGRPLSGPAEGVGKDGATADGVGAGAGAAKRCAASAPGKRRKGKDAPDTASGAAAREEGEEGSEESDKSQEDEEEGNSQHGSKRARGQAEARPQSGVERLKAKLKGLKLPEVPLLFRRRSSAPGTVITGGSNTEEEGHREGGRTSAPGDGGATSPEGAGAVAGKLDRSRSRKRGSPEAVVDPSDVLGTAAVFANLTALPELLGWRGPEGPPAHMGLHGHAKYARGARFLTKDDETEAGRRHSMEVDAEGPVPRTSAPGALLPLPSSADLLRSPQHPATAFPSGEHLVVDDTPEARAAGAFAGQPGSEQQPMPTWAMPAAAATASQTPMPWAVYADGGTGAAARASKWSRRAASVRAASAARQQQQQQMLLVQQLAGAVASTSGSAPAAGATSDDYAAVGAAAGSAEISAADAAASSSGGPSAEASTEAAGASTSAAGTSAAAPTSAGGRPLSSASKRGPMHPGMQGGGSGSGRQGPRHLGYISDGDSEGDEELDLERILEEEEREDMGAGPMSPPAMPGQIKEPRLTQEEPTPSAGSQSALQPSGPQTQHTQQQQPSVRRRVVFGETGAAGAGASTGNLAGLAQGFGGSGILKRRTDSSVNRPPAGAGGTGEDAGGPAGTHSHAWAAQAGATRGSPNEVSPFRPSPGYHAPQGGPGTGDVTAPPAFAAWAGERARYAEEVAGAAMRSLAAGGGYDLSLEEAQELALRQLVPALAERAAVMVWELKVRIEGIRVGG